MRFSKPSNRTTFDRERLEVLIQRSVGPNPHRYGHQANLDVRRSNGRCLPTSVTIDWRGAVVCVKLCRNRIPVVSFDPSVRRAARVVYPRRRTPHARYRAARKNSFFCSTSKAMCRYSSTMRCVSEIKPLSLRRVKARRIQGRWCSVPVPVEGLFHTAGGAIPAAVDRTREGRSGKSLYCLCSQ